MFYVISREIGLLHNHSNQPPRGGYQRVGGIDLGDTNRFGRLDTKLVAIPA